MKKSITKTYAYSLKAVFTALTLTIALSVSAQPIRRDTKKATTNRPYQRMSAGYSHAVEIRNGQLWSYGDNNYGQLGDGTTTQRTTAVQVGTDNKWTYVSAGYQYTLALKADGTLWSWGYNSTYNLGNGSSTAHSNPAQVGVLSTWVCISAGQNHGTAIKADGTLWAWGYNVNGQVGDGTNVTKTAPVQVGTATNWIRVAAGGNHTIALKSDGTLWTWGNNQFGALGDGTTNNRNTPGQIGSATNWVSIAAGGNHSIAIKSDGTIWAWGFNTNGQIGNGTTTTVLAPVQIGAATNWVSASCGWSNTIALKADGTVWGWGDNGSGELGDGTTTQRLSPVQMGTDNLWTTISSGGYFTLGLKASGSLWGVGSNSNGQLGDGTLVNKTNPRYIYKLTNWKSVVAETFSTIGLKTDGTIWSWGQNNAGQLGTGNTSAAYRPTQAGTDTNWVCVNTGSYTTFAIKANGTLWGWGDNSYGEVGDGSTTNRSSPVQIGTATNWVSVYAGYYHSFGIRADGTLWAWGNNSNGQLGDGTTANKTSPVQIGSGNTWAAIAGGFYHALALKTDGTLWAWGRNLYGEVGDGTTTQRTSPVQIGALTTWMGISCGDLHSFGIKADGTLWAWGFNPSGQLGNGTTGNQPAPISIISTTGIAGAVTSITSYNRHASLLKVDGTLWSWGDNAYGQLGDGTTTFRTAPVQSGTNATWVSVAAGSSHSIAVKADRTLYCGTGYNTDGELGDCTTVQEYTYNCIPFAPSIASNPASVSICYLGTATFSVAGNNTASYQWQENGANISDGGSYSGTGTSTLTISNAPTSLNGKVYTCVAGASGTCPPAATSTGATLTVYSQPTVSGSVSPSATICLGQNITLTGGGAVSYDWGSGITNGVAFAPSGGASYYVTGTDAHGCTNTFGPIAVTVNTLPNVTSFVSPSNTVCEGTNISLTGLGAVSYTWSNGVTDGNSFPALSTTTYTVTGTDAHGCQNTNTRLITVNPLPSMTNASSATICSGGTVSVPLTSSVAATYVWLANNNASITGESTTNQTATTLSNTLVNTGSSVQTVSYTVTPTSVTGTCVGATQTITVTVNPKPAMSSASSASVCSGSAVNIPLTSAVPSTYTWIAANNANTTGESTTTQTTSTLNNTLTNTALTPQTVTYSVIPTSIGGSCVGNTQTVSVTVNPKPVMSSGTSATICSGGTVNIPLTSNIASSYNWIAADNVNTTGESTTSQSTASLNNTIANSSSTVQIVTYTVTATATAGGCVSANQLVNVTVNPSDNAGFNYSSSTYCQSGSNPTPTITGLSGGAFSSTSGLSLNTSTGQIILSGSTLGSYTVTYLTTGTCPNTSTANVTITLAPSASFSYPASSYCLNTANVLPNFNSGASAGAFSATPAGLSFVSTSTGEINLTTSTPGTYTVTNHIAAAGGCASATANVAVTINALPLVSFSGLAASNCFNGGVSTLIGSPTGGTFSGPGVSGNTYNTVTAGVGPHTVTYTYTDANTCTNVSSLSTEVLPLPSAPDICEVTVDDVGVYNVIYWDKTSYTNVDSFIIYRETILNTFKRIAAVPFDSLSEFIDTVRHLYPSFTGDPNLGTNKYKLQIRDTCGNYGSLGNWQKTIFVNQTGGVFTFNDYSIEGQQIPVPQLLSYQLWRDDNSLGTWNLLSSNASSPMNDPAYASYPNGNWRILTDWTISCTPTRNNIHTTRSNIKRNAITTGVGQEDLSGLISIYPNPASEIVTIEVQSLKVQSLKVYNVLGEVVYTSEIKTSKSIIDVSSFAKGVYMIELNDNQNKVFKKLVIQ